MIKEGAALVLLASVLGIYFILLSIAIGLIFSRYSDMRIAGVLMTLLMIALGAGITLGVAS